MCRINTIENEPFSILTKVPFELKLWWNDLGKEGHDEVKKYLKGIKGLLVINPRGDIIKAQVTFWDLAHNVFHFSFELTPTLEEIDGYIENAEIPLKEQYPVSPRAITVQRVLDIRLPWGFCTPRFIYDRYGHVRGFNNPNSQAMQ